MVDAAESVPGTDPDRCGFTIAFQTARDQVIQAADVVTTTVGPVGLIGRRGPGHPAPAPAAAGEHPQGQITDLPLQRASR